MSTTFNSRGYRRYIASRQPLLQLLSPGMAGHDNVEYRAFTQVNDTLSRGLRAALPSVAEIAFSKGLIHEITYRDAISNRTPEAERTRNFLTAIRERLWYHPEAFRAFVEILDAENSTKVLAEKMEENLEQVKLRQLLAAAAEHLRSRCPRVASDKPHPLGLFIEGRGLHDNLRDRDNLSTIASSPDPTPLRGKRVWGHVYANIRSLKRRSAKPHTYFVMPQVM